jgi:hypothetical protein
VLTSHLVLLRERSLSSLPKIHRCDNLGAAPPQVTGCAADLDHGYANTKFKQTIDKTKRFISAMLFLKVRGRDLLADLLATAAAPHAVVSHM